MVKNFIDLFNSVSLKDQNLRKVLSILTKIDESDLLLETKKKISKEFLVSCNLGLHDDEMIVFCQRDDNCTDAEDPVFYPMEGADNGDDSIRQEFIDYLMPVWDESQIVFGLEGIEWYGVYVLDSKTYALKEFFILPALGGISKFEHLQKKMIHIVNPTEEFENTLADIPGTTNSLRVLGDIANSLIRRYILHKNW